MTTAFKPGVLVRYNIPDGALARIERYIQDGFYEVQHVPQNNVFRIAHEDDLVLAELPKVEQERVPE